MKATKKQQKDLGMLHNEIVKLWNAGEEEAAYEKLHDFNSLLSDLTGNVMELEEVLSY